MTTAAIRGLKSFVAKYDPAAPISTKEAQKLVTSLSYAFRRQLDSRHPLIDKNSRRSIDTHLSTILSGPHFNESSVGHIPNAVNPDDVSQAEYMSQHWESTNSPMVHFRKCVSAGVATHGLATACLRTEYMNGSGLSPVRVREHAKSSGAGTAVLNWLNGSRHAGDLSFLSHPQLRKLLAFFIIAEGKEHLVWEWLQKLKNTSAVHLTSPNDQIVLRRFQYSIIQDILGFEWRCGHERQTLVENFSRRAQEISLVAGGSVIDGLLCWFTRLVGGFKLSTVELLSRIIDEWDTDPLYRCALVDLYRPQHASGFPPSLKGPDLAPALTLLQQYPMETIFTDSHRRRQDLMLLSFRLVDLLLRDGSDATMRSATWVMGFLRAHFMAEILHEERREREKHNLILLDTLSKV